MNTNKKLPTFYTFEGRLYYRQAKIKTLWHWDYLVNCWRASYASYDYALHSDIPITPQRARRKFPVAFPLKDKLPKHIEA